jgi:hypothetical protein
VPVASTYTPRRAGSAGGPGFDGSGFGVGVSGVSGVTGTIAGSGGTVGVGGTCSGSVPTGCSGFTEHAAASRSSEVNSSVERGAFWTMHLVLQELRQSNDATRWWRSPAFALQCAHPLCRRLDIPRSTIEGKHRHLRGAMPMLGLAHLGVPSRPVDLNASSPLSA